MAAKTGTTQVIGIKRGESWHAGSVARNYHDHALFIAYAPAKDPEFAVAVIAENGDWGSTTAGPIAKAVIDFYLLHKRPAANGQATSGRTATGQPAAEQMCSGRQSTARTQPQKAPESGGE